MISRTLLLLAVLLAPTFCAAQIAVIVNVANPIQQLSVTQVTDFYLGRSRAYASGEYALVFDYGRDAALRQRFFQSLAGMSPQQVNAYWSRLMFTGQVLPPQPLPDDRAMLDIVRRNAGAIGYIRNKEADPSVRVVLLLKE